MPRFGNRRLLYFVPASLVTTVTGGTIGGILKAGTIVRVGPYEGSVEGAGVGFLAGVGIVVYYLIKVTIGPHETPDPSLELYRGPSYTDD